MRAAAIMEDPRLMAQRSLACYASALKPKFRQPPHIDIIIQALEMVERGDIKRLMIFAPPRHGKSLLTSQIFPAWYMGLHPDHMVMVCCHTQQLATQFGGKIRSNLLSPIHRGLFPDYQMAPDSNAKHEWKTTKEGEFFAAGVGVGIAGRGCHLLLIDDPIKNAEDAMSDAVIENLHSWFQSDAYTRLEPDGAVVIIQTRWTENDLSGWLLNEAEQDELDDWQIISLPAIAEEEEGWRQPGEPLWPDRFPLPLLEKIRTKMPEYMWTALYQQRPSAIEGRIFKRSWWGQYIWNPHMAADRNLGNLMVAPYRIIQSWDTAFEEDEQNDYSTCQTWLSTAEDDYLLDVYRKRLIAPDLFDRAVELAIYWRATAILVEQKASGHSLIQHLKRNPLTKKFPVLGRVPRGKKLVRAQAVSPYVQSGHVHLPLYQYAPWLRDFVDEVSGFPTAAHDDQVDALSQYLDYIYEERHQLEQYSIFDDPMEQLSPYDV